MGSRGRCKQRIRGPATGYQTYSEAPKQRTPGADGSNELTKSINTLNSLLQPQWRRPRRLSWMTSTPETSGSRTWLPRSARPMRAAARSIPRLMRQMARQVQNGRPGTGSPAAGTAASAATSRPAASAWQPADRGNQRIARPSSPDRAGDCWILERRQAQGRPGRQDPGAGHRDVGQHPGPGPRDWREHPRLQQRTDRLRRAGRPAGAHRSDAGFRCRP